MIERVKVMSTSIVYSNVFKLEKKTKKRKTHGKSKSKTSKPKKTGSNINGKKKKRQKGGNMGKNGLVHLHFCCFFFAFSICFFAFVFFLLFFAFAWKKANKNKIKQNKSKKKQIEKAKKKQQKCKWTSPCVSHFLPFYFAFVFFGFC